jgi:hypothetical protein
MKISPLTKTSLPVANKKPNQLVKLDQNRTLSFVRKRLSRPKPKCVPAFATEGMAEESARRDLNCVIFRRLLTRRLLVISTSYNCFLFFRRILGLIFKFIHSLRGVDRL